MNGVDTLDGARVILSTANRWSTADERFVLNESEIVIPQMGRQKMLFRELNHYKENLYSSLSVDSGQNNKEILTIKEVGLDDYP